MIATNNIASNDIPNRVKDITDSVAAADLKSAVKRLIDLQRELAFDCEDNPVIISYDLYETIKERGQEMIDRETYKMETRKIARRILVVLDAVSVN